METGNFSPDFREISRNVGKLRESGSYSGIFYYMAVRNYAKDGGPIDETKCINHLIDVWKEANFINEENDTVNNEFMRGEITKEYNKVKDGLGTLFGRGRGIIKDKMVSYNALMEKLREMKGVTIMGLYILGRTDMVAVYRGLDVIGDLATEYVLHKEVDARMAGKPLRIRGAASYLMGTVYKFYEDNYEKTLLEVIEQIEIERKMASNDEFE